MSLALARRRITAVVIGLIIVGYFALTAAPHQLSSGGLTSELQQQYFGDLTAIEALETLEVKGRVPKTGYQRAQFGSGWARVGTCDMRNIILARDLRETVIDQQCRVERGVLQDPYTAEEVEFRRGPTSSQAVQIDHVVALSDAWQKGAQQLTLERRTELANDPLNLIAVSGTSNQQKGDSDAASWLPPNREFRCQYVARQVAVKVKYRLWATHAEKAAIAKVLDTCEVR